MAMPSNSSMKTFKFFAVSIITALVIFAACTDDQPSPLPPPPPPPLCDFDSTEWKLVSYVDILNGTEFVPPNLQPNGKYDYLLIFRDTLIMGTNNSFSGFGGNSCLNGNHTFDCSSSTISFDVLYPFSQ